MVVSKKSKQSKAHNKTKAHNKSKVHTKTKKSRHHNTTLKKNKPQSKSLSKSQSSIKTLSDLKSQKSLSTLSSIKTIKSDTTIGELYNLTDLNENISKLCINKVKNKKYNNIQLDKTIAKKLCHCMFEKNNKLTVEQLENKIKQKLHTPGSECIKILDKFIKDKSKGKSKGKKSTNKPSSSKT